MALRFALVLFAGFICGSSLYAQAPANPRTDSLGDPLPPGAVARLGTLRFKHNFATRPLLKGGDDGVEEVVRRNMVSNVLFSPDGKKVASLSAANVRLWDATSGKELVGPWSSLDYSTAVFAFSPDGSKLAVAGLSSAELGKGAAGKRQITVWDVVQPKLVRNIVGMPADVVLALAFADAGKTLVSAGFGTVRWWDVATGKEKRAWKPFGDEQGVFDGGTKTKTFYRCAISPGGKYLAVYSAWEYKPANPQQPFNGVYPTDDQDIWGFDLTTSKTQWRTRASSADFQFQFGFSADEKYVAQTVAADKVELRETGTGKLVAAPPLDSGSMQTQRIGALALSADGTTLAIGGTDSHVVLWNAGEPTRFREFSGRITQQPSASSLRCLAFSHDSKTLMAGLDADIQLYDVATLKEVFQWDGHRGFVDYVSFVPDGKHLITGSATLNLSPNEVINWDTATWKAKSITSVRSPKWPNIGTLSPEHAVYTGRDGDDRFCIYDHATGNKLGQLQVPKNQSITALGFFSPASRFYVLANQGDTGKVGFQFFEIPSGKRLFEVPLIISGGLPIVPLAFSPDGRFLAYPSQGGVIHVHDMTNGADCQRLGSLPEGVQAELLRYPDRGLGNNLVFSPNGMLLASWMYADDVISVWDLKKGKDVIRLPPGTQKRFPVKFAWSPDGRTLAVGERKIQLFEIATGKLRREFEGHQGAIRSLAFSPDGRLLASGSADTTVLIWDVWGR